MQFSRGLLRKALQDAGAGRARQVAGPFAWPVRDSTRRQSSLRIVPVAVGTARVAPTGDERVTVNVSSGSMRVSPTTRTVTCPRLLPAGMVSVPEAAR